jgi:hypothetical protein
MAKKIKTITLCSSVSFYKDVLAIDKTVKKMGFKTLVPEIARVMKKNNDFEISHYKTWFANPSDYHKKTKLMQGHFKKVKKADAIIVINLEKNNMKGYIGGNVLLEMFLAYMDKKPIFILYDIDEHLPLKEEILGFSPIFLHGDLQLLASK